jgi:hypothetical protein
VASAFFLFSSKALMAQDSTVQVVKDWRIDVLIKKQAQINKVAAYKNSRGEYKGFRIMILNTTNREAAYKARADILRNFPDQTVYMGYQSPYYKVKMGDFLKRADADKFRKDISPVFNQNTFIIQDIINLSPEEEARLLKEEDIQ